MSEQVVSSGQKLSGQSVNAGDSLVVLSGGEITDITVTSGASDTVYGQASATILQATASETVQEGGVAIGTVVSSAAIQTVLLGGFASATEVLSGGNLFVASNGAVKAAMIENGGLLTVSSGGFASAVNVQSGGNLFVSAGGLASDTQIGSGGTATIGSGAQSLADHVAGALTVSAGGVLTQAQVLQGGTVTVESGAFGTASVVSAGGAEIVASGGFVSGTEVYGSGLSTVMGLASGTVLDSFAVQNVSAGGVAVGTVVGSAAAQIVGGGGLGSATDVQSGGEVYVVSLGAVQNAVVEDGGLITVSSGGAALDTVLRSGGTMSFQSGGFGSNTTIEDNGWLIVSAGAQSIGDQVLSGGMLIASSGGAVTSAVVSAGGYVVVSAGGESDGVIISSGGMEIISSGGQATQTQLLSGGQIDFDALAYSSAATTAFDSGTGVLTVQDGDLTSTIDLVGDYAGLYFHFSKDAGDGSLVLTADGTPCYCRGTRIMTPDGEVAVEDLRIGDMLLTASGEARPLRWVGRRTYTAATAAGDPEILPVMFRAGSLGEHIPRRDLFVSPLHAMFIDGRLVPAMALVNGISIVQAASIDSVDYFHLELETHDILLAEGAAAESFVDDDSRSMFHNAEDYARLYPDAVRQPALYCAPHLEEGEVLAALRERLQVRAALCGALPSRRRNTSSFRGHLDSVSHHYLRGWAYDLRAPGALRLRILDNGRTIGIVDANTPRGDLRAAGHGNGCHGFEFAIPGGLDPRQRHVIQVQSLLDQNDLAGSPIFLDATTTASEVPGELGLIVDGGGEATGHLPSGIGYLDNASHRTVSGWAWNPEDTLKPVAIQVFANGRLLSRVVANTFRPDLMAAGIGTARYGFELDVDAVLDPQQRYVIQAFIEETGRPLLGAPKVVEPVDAFNETFTSSIARVLSALETREAREAALEFMLTEAGRVRQQIVDAEAGREQREKSRRRKRTLGPLARDMDLPAPRALVIDDRLPSPSRDAGSNAVLSHIRALKSLGYAVSFVATDGFGRRDEAEAAPLAALGVTVCGSPLYGTVEEVLRRQADCFDVVYMHRISTAGSYMKLVRQTMPRARILYSVADLHHLRLQRQAQAEGRPELLGLSNRTRLEEFTAAWQADAVLTHSAMEADLLRRSVPAARVYQAPWEHQVSVSSEDPGFDQRSGLVFLGNFSHQPNQDAACWLVEQVMPLVWKKDPSIRCRLVGPEATSRIRDLAGENVEVTGHVPDLAAVWGSARLSVAPLRYGAGIKGKVLESLAAGVPCVMTEMAAEGLDLPGALRGWIGNDAKALAERILTLHSDRGAWQHARLDSQDYIRESFSADIVRDALQTAIEGRREAVAGGLAA